MNLPFEQSVELHGTTVLRVCRAILGPGTDADDAWSETFLAAMKAWPELDDSTNVEAWLVRVSHHKAVDITRQQARRARVNSSVPPE
ncbi:RNA polymerase sigma factor, partial [Corynebacterium casei]